MNPESFQGAQAWRALVPLRVKLASGFAIPPFPLAVAFTEGFFYPHGVAFAVTVELTERKPIEEVVKALIDLQQNRRLVPPDAKAAGPLKLSGYAVQCLGALRARAFGGKPEPAHVPLDPPFSIATILKGDGAAADPAIADQGPTHRLLEALTRWSPTWERDALPKLADPATAACTPSLTLQTATHSMRAPVAASCGSPARSVKLTGLTSLAITATSFMRRCKWRALAPCHRLPWSRQPRARRCLLLSLIAQSERRESLGASMLAAQIPTALRVLRFTSIRIARRTSMTIGATLA